MKISVVTTLYRSARYVAEFHRRALGAVSSVTSDIEFVYVDDGSPDESLDAVKALLGGRAAIRIVVLSRNYGHHPAIMTGLAHATGDLVFLVDSDLEEPPELFMRLYERLRSAPAADPIDVVFATQTVRKGGIFERVTGALFYSLFNLLSVTQVPPNWMIARLMTQRYVRALIAHEEREIFLGGLMRLAGFRQEGVEATKGSRGTTTYSVAKRALGVLNAVTSFSDRPLLLIFAAGIVFSLLSFFGLVYLLARIYVFGVQYLAGWASTMLLINFFGGLTLASIGVVGLYLARVFVEVKRRPCVVKEVLSSEDRA